MPTNNSPRVSIIIPAYNAAKYLETSVDSVEKQSYKNIEMIIVDDGSSDDTLAVAKKLRANNSSIKIISQENTGPGGARNKGLAAVSGQYVLFLDADDLYFSWSVEKLVQEAVSSDADIVVSSNIVESSAPKSALIHTKQSPTEAEEFTGKECYKSLLYNRVQAAPWAKLYKVSAIGNNRFSDLQHAEDLEFNLRVFKTVKKICILRRPAIQIYVQSRNSLMRTEYNDKKHDEMFVLRKMQKEFDSANDESIKKALAAAIFFHSLGLLNSIHESKESRQKYSDDYRELKKLVRRHCWSVVRDKNVSITHRRYAAAACTSVRLMLYLMSRAGQN